MACCHSLTKAFVIKGAERTLGYVDYGRILTCVDDKLPMNLQYGAHQPEMLRHSQQSPASRGLVLTDPVGFNEKSSAPNLARNR